MARQPGYFTKIEVADPRLAVQSIWENLPPREKVLLNEREFSSQEWAPLDRRRFRIEPESYRTELSIANVGALRLSRSAHSQATRMTTRLPAVDAFGISIIERGTSRLVFPGTDEPVTGNATMGYIFSLEPGIHATQSDLHNRLLLRLPTVLLHRKLEALLDGQKVQSIAFEPMFDQTRGAGATIRRMFDFLFAELEHPDTLLTNESRSAPSRRTWRSVCCWVCRITTARDYSGRRRPQLRTMCGGPKRSCRPMPRYR